jgi:hypothetical protein
MNSVDIPANEIFSSSLNVSDAEGSFWADQTNLMDGYSLDIYKAGVEKFISSDNVFIYYKGIGHPESIATYFTGTSFSITKVEKIADKCYLIEGSFNTKLLKKPDYQNDFVSSNLTDGKFRFIKRL